MLLRTKWSFMQESVTVTGLINTVQPNEGTYNQILAGDDLQVTFDNNGDNNYWSFHAGGSFPHITGSYKQRKCLIFSVMHEPRCNYLGQHF